MCISPTEKHILGTSILWTGFVGAVPTMGSHRHIDNLRLCKIGKVHHDLQEKEREKNRIFQERTSFAFISSSLPPSSCCYHMKAADCNRCNQQFSVGTTRLHTLDETVAVVSMHVQKCKEDGFRTLGANCHHQINFPFLAMSVNWHHCQSTAHGWQTQQWQRGLTCSVVADGTRLKWLLSSKVCNILWNMGETFDFNLHSLCDWQQWLQQC